MNILFVNELKTVGLIGSNNINMRPEFVFCSAVNAFHINYNELVKSDSVYSSVIDSADVAIIVPSKQHPIFLKAVEVLNKKKIPFAIMQEGPNTYWQNWPPEYQLLYLKYLQQDCTMVLCHNKYDKTYYQGITKKPVEVLPTIHFVTQIQQHIISPKVKSNTVFIGGNITQWYNGMTSYLVSNQKEVDGISFPSMGKKHESENELLPRFDQRVFYYPYFSNWLQFMNELNKYKIGVHLMPQVAAGSFSLNCAMLGIPCIGNILEDTQRICFPNLSIDINDTKQAKEILHKLLTNSDFYNQARKTALEKVKEFDIEYNKKHLLQLIEKIRTH